MQGKMRQDLYQELYNVENTHWWHLHKRAVVHNLIKKFAKKGKILDVGAGTGKILSELKDKGWQVRGADGEKEAVTWCKKREVVVDLIDVHQNKLPYNNNEFDVVMALDVLEHVPNDLAVLDEMKRVVKPSGCIIVTVPAYQWLFSYWDTMLGHQRRYSKQHLIDRCQEAGLTITYSSYYVCLLLLLAVPVRLLKQLLGNKATNQSDFQTTPLARLTVPLLTVYSKFERWVMSFLSLPFGLSVVCVAKK